ncbi:MAG: hypothetical protein LBP68_08700 [Acidobacteriota bacterium]|jgi:hypothetical protein|nr:hypothetical protein [Acidobacteriota bacterium]
METKRPAFHEKLAVSIDALPSCRLKRSFDAMENDGQVVAVDVLDPALFS